MLNLVEYAKSFITLGPDLVVLLWEQCDLGLLKIFMGPIINIGHNFDKIQKSVTFIKRKFITMI